MFTRRTRRRAFFRTEPKKNWTAFEKLPESAVIPTGVNRVPLVVLVSPSGEVESIWRGEITAERLPELKDALLD